MKKILLVLGLYLWVIACSVAPYYPTETTLIEGQTFNQQVIITGHQYDGLVIRDCVFENISANSALRIESVNNLVISNCTFRNIGGHGVRLWHEGEGTSNVIIVNNQISNIYYNGIMVHEPNFNLIIRGNDISHVGLDWAGGALTGKPHHGIYCQAPGFLIESNRIYNNYDNSGNVVSVRSYGTIRGNTLYHGPKRGITYYADHPGFGGQLLIENNIVFDNGFNAIGLDSAGVPANHIGSVVIRFNTLLQMSEDTIRLNESMNGITAEIYGNIIINENTDGQFIKSTLSLTQYQNIMTNVDIGFADYASRDLTLGPVSPAIDYANGIVSFPATDIQGEARPQGQLDAGADERL